MPILPSSARSQAPQSAQPASEPQPAAQQSGRYLRPYIPFDPNLYHQVQLRRAMREQAEREAEAMEAESEESDEDSKLPALEQTRFAPLLDLTREKPDRTPEIALTDDADSLESRAPMAVLFERGLAAFQGRTYHNAMRAFQQLYEVAPDNLETRFAYGLALFASNRFERASEILPQVIEEAERAGVELPAISTFYANERDYRSHRAALERQRALTPGNDTLEGLVKVLPISLVITEPTYSMAQEATP